MKKRRQQGHLECDLEQVFVEGSYGVFQAGILLTNTSLLLFENSRETSSKNRHSLHYEIDFKDVIDMRLRDPKDVQEEVIVLPKTSQLLADPCFQKKTCHILRIYFRPNDSNQTGNLRERERGRERGREVEREVEREKGRESEKNLSYPFSSCF